MKPLTTIGDALLAKGADWRAELRAAEVPRRTPLPPSSTRLDRPDRGYVEQPEERVEKTTTQFPPPRRRTETPVITAPTALIRFTRDPVPKLETPEMRPPEPEPAPPEESEESPDHGEADPDYPEHAEHFAEPAPAEQPKAKRKQRVFLPIGVKLAAVRRALKREEFLKDIAADLGVHQTALSRWVGQVVATGAIDGVPIGEPPPQPTAPIAAPKLEEAMPASKKPSGVSEYSEAERDRFAKRILAGSRGENAKVARELGLTDATVSYWVLQYRKRQKKQGGAERTLTSAPPQSGPMSAPGNAPPLPTIRVGGFDNPTFEIYGLQAYIEHMVRLGVKAELKRRLGDD
jgi:transposase-like protein